MPVHLNFAQLRRSINGLVQEESIVLIENISQHPSQFQRKWPLNITQIDFLIETNVHASSVVQIDT